MKNILKKIKSKFNQSKIKEKMMQNNFKAPENPFGPVKDPVWEKIKKENFEIPDDSPLKKNPFHYTEKISFELSNFCNYSMYHQKCPAHLQKELKVLPLSLIEKTIDTLGKYNFSGKIAFHNYNEPLIDPRLFYILKYTKEKCPNASFYICTNGYYLDQTIGEELAAFGVTKIHVSIYFKKELERLQKIKLPVPCDLQVMELDDTLNIYSGPIKDCNKKCSAPLREVVVSKDGDISLCCYDWAYIYKFGNLKEKTLDQIVSSGLMYKIYSELSEGNRFLNICKNCRWHR